MALQARLGFWRLSWAPPSHVQRAVPDQLLPKILVSILCNQYLRPPEAEPLTCSSPVSSDVHTTQAAISSDLILHGLPMKSRVSSPRSGQLVVLGSRSLDRLLPFSADSRGLNADLPADVIPTVDDKTPASSCIPEPWVRIV